MDENDTFHLGTFDAVRGNFAAASGRGSPFHSLEGKSDNTSLHKRFSIVIAFIASLFFCLGSAELKSGKIRELSGTYWDGNASLKRFFVSLKADYLCGALALCVAFFLQFLANVPGEVPSETLIKDPKLGAAIAVLSGLVVGGAFWLYRSWVINKLHKELAASPKE